MTNTAQQNETYGELVSTKLTRHGNEINAYKRPTPYDALSENEWYFVVKGYGVILRAMNESTVTDAAAAIIKNESVAADKEDELDGLIYMKETI